MHRLAAQPGAIPDGAETIERGQIATAQERACARQGGITHHDAPGEDRVCFVSKLADVSARLGDKAPAERRVAIVLVPDRDGQVENPEAIMEVLRSMAADGNALVEALRTGPAKSWRQVAAREAHETLALPDYFLFFNAVPHDLQEAVRKRWGAPEADPFFKPGELSCGEFLLPVRRWGNVAVGIQPVRGCDTDPPPHSCFALHAWLRDQFRADAVIHVGGNGSTSPHAVPETEALSRE